MFLQQRESDEINWQEIERRIKEAEKDVIPKRRRSKQNNWMRDEILALMETRKTKKNPNENRIIRQRCRSAKEKEVQERCEQIQEMEKRNDVRQMYMKVKKLAPKSYFTKVRGLESKDGAVLLEENEINQLCQEYTNELYESKRENKKSLTDDCNSNRKWRSQRMKFCGHLSTSATNLSASNIHCC